MKKSNKLISLLRPGALGLLLGSTTLSLQAQTNLVIDTFNDDSTLTYWVHDWGSAGSTFEFDPGVDAGGNSGSGALKITVAYDLASFGGGNDCAIQRVLTDLGGAVDFTIYTNLHYDVYVDTNSAHLSVSWGNAQMGQMNWYLRDPSWNFASQGGPWIPADNYGQWQHKVVGLDPLMEWNNGTNYVGTNVARMGYQMWSGWSDGGLTNSVTYWIDNVYLEYNTNTAPPPPPTLTLSSRSSHKGLVVVESASGQYPRQSIATDMTANNDYGWVGKGSTPVTYSLTIADFPGPKYSAFQAHVFLTPTYGSENSPDWNQPNVVFLQISEETNGVATATFRYKTNLAGGNAMMYNGNPTNGPVGILGTLDCATGPLGTWALKFVNDTDITLTAPDGTSTNFTMTADAAALFGGNPLRAYFGIQPNDASYRGVSATFSRVQISGVAAPIDDSFPGPDINQDPAKVSWQWVKQADDPTGFFVSDGNYPYWVNWTLPDSGFRLQVSPDLKTWSDAAVTNVFNLGTQRSAAIPTSALPNSKSGYFRLSK